MQSDRLYGQVDSEDSQARLASAGVHFAAQRRHQLVHSLICRGQDKPRAELVREVWQLPGHTPLWEGFKPALKVVGRVGEDSAVEPRHASRP